MQRPRARDARHGPVVLAFGDERGDGLQRMVELLERRLKTVLDGQLVERLLYQDGLPKPARNPEDIPFYRSQMRIVLAHNGYVDPTSIDDYIAAFPAPTRKKLTQLRKLIRKIVPNAEEKISYQMPTFHLNGNLVHFAAYDRHIGLYPIANKFRTALAGYKTGKGSVQFPLEEPLPTALIARIVEDRAKESARKKTGAYPKKAKK